ncbi:MAG TPA: hypothetical protein VFR91_01040 [Dyella sp.]|nr:hypothetical protein [Dyella sp.]
MPPAAAASVAATDSGDTLAMPSLAAPTGRRAVFLDRSGRLLERYAEAVTPVGGNPGLPCGTAAGPRMLRNGVLGAVGHDDCAPALAWSRALLPSAASSLGMALSARVLAVGASGPAAVGAAGSSPDTRGGIVTASVGGATPAATAPTITATHPRMILDAATLATLRSRAAANTAEWQALKATCDSYIGGTVEYPTGNAYPDKPNLGSGYQGEDYLPALLAEAMCYQVLRTTNASQAATYGAKAVDILVKMSSPFGSGGQGTDPCTDSGYGIRFYGVGFGLGYDWLYDLLSASQRSQVYTTANAWLTKWEQPNGCADFEYAHPQSNYFAGYFHAKAVIAIGTYGENPSAPAEWTDWYGNQFTARVLPYYRLHLAGGGWPEGFANYATLGIFNMSLPAREVKTATGVDLVHATSAYTYPTDNAAYLMHFTWPSRGYIDDRDTNRSSGSTPDPGTAPLGLFQQVFGEIQYWGASNAAVFRQYLDEVSGATGGFSPAAPWLAFLENDPGATKAAVSTLPLSYLATGMSAVSARSDWTGSAVWMSFRAGPYVNNPAQGEEYYDQGSLALVHGARPLLLNATGWLVHDPNGSADEGRVYDDNYASFNGTPYKGNRQIYNVFYVRNMSGATVLNAYGQDSNTTEDNAVRTGVTAFEDGGDYVYLRATHLEDMYRASGGSLGQGVTAWSREVTYLRPGRFVVHDRTTASSASLDQYMAWHFPAAPAKQSTAASGARFDVTYSGAYVGSMTVVTPVNPATTTLAMYPASSPTKAWQVQVRPATAATTNQWLTVFDLPSSAAGVATASPVTVNQGNVVGVRLAATDGVSVVVNSAGTPGTPLTGTIAYFVPAEAAHHLVTELQPFTGYTITATAQAGGRVVTIAPGGTFTSSGKGVLDFYVSGTGTVQLTKPTYTTLPISTIPVSDPVPYTPPGG